MQLSPASTAIEPMKTASAKQMSFMIVQLLNAWLNGAGKFACAWVSRCLPLFIVGLVNEEYLLSRSVIVSDLMVSLAD